MKDKRTKDNGGMISDELKKHSFKQTVQTDPTHLVSGDELSDWMFAPRVTPTFQGMAALL